MRRNIHYKPSKSASILSGVIACAIAAAVFYAVNYPAAVSTAATTRQLPIYSVERAQKVCAISFDAAWGEGKVRHGCREREQDRAINAWGIRLSSLNTHQGKAAKSPCRRFCSFLRLLLCPAGTHRLRHGRGGGGEYLRSRSALLRKDESHLRVHGTGGRLRGSD